MNASPFFTWRIFAVDPSQLTSIERALLRVCLAIGVVVVAWTFRDTGIGAGDDLRNRIVGARVMLAGYDSYTFHWQTDMPEEWLDPIYDAKAHRLTASPPMLMLYVPLAPLPYRLVRLVSYLLEWLAMIGSLALLSRSLPSQRLRVIFLVTATVFIIATDVWRLHIERGQLYAFHLLALSAAIYWSSQGSCDSIAGGVAFGLLALMRPNLLLFAPGLLVLRQWRSASAMVATVVVGTALTTVVLPSSAWRSYLAVGDQYYRAIQAPESVADLPRPEHEGPVEGYLFGTNSLTNVESSSFGVLYQTLSTTLPLPAIDLAVASKVVLVAIAIGLLFSLGVRGGSAGFALMVVGALNTEFCLPHRWGYADVMLLAPLALMLPALLSQPWAAGLVLIGLLCGPLGQQFFSLYVATVLRSWLVMIGLTALAFQAAHAPNNRTL